MAALPASIIFDSMIELLTEAYEGPPIPASTWFIDNEPDSGIFGLLSRVAADQASRSVDGSGEEGTTIVAHAEHLRWSLAMMNAAIRGEPQGKWKESWRMIDANEAEWGHLRGELREEFETLRQAFREQEDLPAEYLTGVLALLPHAAYHLGTIRQMIERTRR